MTRVPIFSRDLNGLPRNSETVKSAAYDLGKRILEIQFHRTDAVYQYYEVPPLVFTRFMAAHSKGGFVHAVLKDYEYRRVE